ncbi:MAG: hypothetical protein KDE47_16040 [Caldilineaceae bacterium]|nr:hypothetical protein [Caldilineaceae bacterium]
MQIRSGEAAQALPLLERLSALTPDAEQAQPRLELNVVHALALSAVGEQQKALSLLVQTLRAAKPAGYIRIFSDEGMSMQRLLQQLRRDALQSTSVTPHPAYAKLDLAYIDQVLATFQAPDAMTNAPSVTRPPTQPASLFPVEPLTERELDVLGWMAQGLSNTEIAEALVIAVSTVRTHIKNIYGKLAARNRVQAVTQAHELGLLAAA